MSHWRSRVCRDDKHLHHWDLEGVSPLEVTIEANEDDKVYNSDSNEETTMLFIRFKGAQKSLGLNVTNATIIEAVTGESDPDKWAGKKIVLRRAMCRDDECIRVDLPEGAKLPGACPKFAYIDKKKGGTK